MVRHLSLDCVPVVAGKKGWKGVDFVRLQLSQQAIKHEGIQKN